MTYGYNNPGSSTFHANQRCSGTVFTAAASIGSHAAENRGLSPCKVCCNGEWPHKDDD